VPSSLEPLGSTDGGGVLVVGASQAGTQLASSLRELGWTAPITLVGAEEHLPYQRPPLSKKALREGIDPSVLALRGERFFADQAIELALGQRIADLTVAADGSGQARSESGRQFPFTRLALTVGARPRRLDIPGAALSGVYYLRETAHAEDLRHALVEAPRVLVVGGGFIGLEVAATARQLGCEVTVVLADDRLMARAVSPAMSEHFLHAHQERGVEVLCSVLPAAFLDDGAGRVRAVQLVDGRELPADLVVIGVGAQPRVELAEKAGLLVEGGIVTDAHGLCSDGVTVAAGDCSVWPVPAAPRGRMRFESVNAATEQAKVAAATLVGRPAAWTSAPWFWSDQYDLKLQVAGLVPAAGATVVRSNPARPGRTVLHYQDNRLVAAECVNWPADLMAARSAITAGRTVDPVLAADGDRPLKSLIIDTAEVVA
jgi:3-phenylpropionate/trans-cinnamate dioxygenase ferredoxin reductase subunit